MSTTNQSGKFSLRAEMPETAKWIDRRRAEYGAAYVNGCIRRAMGTSATDQAPAVPGEPGLFYAIEAGRVLGTPFPFDSAMTAWQRLAIVAGLKFAAFLLPPPGVDGSYAAISAGHSEGTNGKD